MFNFVLSFKMVFFRPILALGAILAAIAPVNGVIVRITPLGDSLTGGPVSDSDNTLVNVLPIARINSLSGLLARTPLATIAGRRSNQH